MNIFKSKTVSRLEERLRDKTAEIIRLQGLVDDNTNAFNRRETNHRDYISQIENVNTLEVNKLTRKIDVLEGDFESKLTKAIKDEKTSLGKAKKNLEKDYEQKTKKLEREAEATLKKLNKEHVEKLAKMDSRLEQDKASYRKYIRQENNNEVETLQKENKRLFTENQTLTGENSGLETTVGILEKQIESVTEFADGVATKLGSLSEKIADGLVKGMPTVSAEITTPEVIVQLPKQELPAKQGGGNQEQKKN